MIRKLQEELEGKIHEVGTIQKELKASEADADKLRDDLKVSYRPGGTFEVNTKFIRPSVSRLL